VTFYLYWVYNRGNNMATVLFGEFGGKHHERSVFNLQEKALLMVAVSGATESLSKALISSNKNFSGHVDQIKLWFGDVTAEHIVELKKNVNKMHSTLTAPETFITFIDARGQYLHPYMGRMPLNNIADAQYDELIMKGGEREKLDEFDSAFVYPLSWVNPHGEYKGHVGSGMNIYINHDFFSSHRNNRMREEVILHEYSHKALFTVDYAVETPEPGCEDDAWFVYGEEDCQYLATQNVEDTMRNADCLAYFLSSFNGVGRLPDGFDKYKYIKEKWDSAKRRCSLM